MWVIGYFFTLLFLCGTRFNAYWTSSKTEESECLPTKPVHLGYAISDVITDVLVILLPIPEVGQCACRLLVHVTDLNADMEASFTHSSEVCHYRCICIGCNVGDSIDAGDRHELILQ